MYQIGEHIMYKNIGICVVEEIGKPGFSADKEKEYPAAFLDHGDHIHTF